MSIPKPINRQSKCPGLNRSEYDPLRHFVLCYTLRAVRDAFFPVKKLTRTEITTALEFINSEDGQALISHFGIPVVRIRQRLHENGNGRTS